MDAKDLTPIWNLIGTVAAQLGTGAVVFVIGLHKEWWVMGSQYRALQSHAQRYANLAEVNGRVADTGLEIAKR